MARFTAAAIASIAVIAVGVFFLAQRVTTREAIRDARNVTLATGANAIAPVLTDGLLTGDAQSIAAVDQVVRARVLRGDIVRVKIWREDGTILYSDQTSIIGQRFPLAEDELEAFDGSPTAELSELSAPENSTENSFNKLLEVYDGVKTPSGEPVLFEAYLRYDSVEDNASRLLTAIAPAFGIGLALLLIVQIPLALGLARRLEQGQREREELLKRNLETSETERRRMAADLHDGVVQKLVGSSYSLSAAATEAAQRELPEMSASLSNISVELRQSVRELRTMIVTVAPPRLREEGLHSAIHDLTSVLEKDGVTVELDVASLDLSEDDESLLYRVVQESVRNVVKHARASHISVTVSAADSGGAQCAIADNGNGFADATHDQRKREGHVGLHLLTQLVNDAGGKLLIDSEPGRGTTISAELPAR